MSQHHVQYMRNFGSKWNLVDTCWQEMQVLLVLIILHSTRQSDLIPLIFKWHHTKYEVKKSKNQAISVTGRGSLQGREMLRIPHCLDNQLTDGGEVVSPMHQQDFTP
jgi:hypothetical protein